VPGHAPPGAAAFATVETALTRARSLLVAAAAVLAALPAAPSAEAAISYTPCAPAPFRCGRLAAPLDRGGAVAGTVTLQIRRLAAGGAPARTAVVALAGGPGQPAIPAAQDFVQLLAPALAGRDLIVFDQRGTGLSGRLRCPALERGARSLEAAAGACARQIGPARGSYRTEDTVDDIEAIRQESGYERLVLFGVSYGTKVAEDYAARYPGRVEALVLDSVVPPEGSDVFNRSSLRAVAPALRELCGGGACAGITRHPAADVAALVRRLERRPLRGAVTDPVGRHVRLTLTPTSLFALIVAGDLNPTLRAELPGALRGALRGDAAPILRLRARAAGLTGIPGTPRQSPLAGADSDALFAATRCEESAFPWDRAAGAQARAAQAEAAARALPPAALGPFTAEVALRSDVIPLCVGWPNASPAPAPPGPLPAVPALILSGGTDVRTPTSDARAVAARIPGAHVVTVPFTGHSVLGSDLSGCARRALTAFFGGAGVPRCTGAPRVFAPTPVAPTRLAQVNGGSAALRTLNALRLTVSDISRQFIGDALAASRAPEPGGRVGGLRSGSATWTRGGVRFLRVEYVPGVLVSGFAPHAEGRAARFTVTGAAAARGHVRFSGSGRVTAVLGGRRISAQLSRGVTARAGAAPHAPRLLPHPRVVRLG
jgi:pimeloyl-ACP methyl ester carboxylesterase